MPATQSRINDFVLKIGTVNGTGSASANGLLMKSLFRMGIPVTGKNMFPSNIQGLPTWYEIRANHQGYKSYVSHVDVMVAMNAQTYQKDLSEVSPLSGWVSPTLVGPIPTITAEPSLPPPSFTPSPLPFPCGQDTTSFRGVGGAYHVPLARLLSALRDALSPGRASDDRPVKT